jgi:hypothetical protein
VDSTADKPISWFMIGFGSLLVFAVFVGELACLVQLARGSSGEWPALLALWAVGALLGAILVLSLRHELAKVPDRLQSGIVGLLMGLVVASSTFAWDSGTAV